MRVLLLVTNPDNNDVLCGRGIRINGHVENVQFRKIIGLKKSEYLAQNSRKGKTLISARIVSNIRTLVNS